MKKNILLTCFILITIALNGCTKQDKELTTKETGKTKEAVTNEPVNKENESKKKENETADIKTILNKLCKAIVNSDKNVLKEYSGLTPDEIISGFTNEFDETAKPECNAEHNLNYKHSETEFYIYASEGGDGYSSMLLKFENGKWLAKEFIYNDELEKIKKKR